MANGSDGTAGKIDVAVENRSGFAIDANDISGKAAKALALLGAGGGELGIIFVSPEEISSLNRKHLGRVGATDVLAFPLDATGQTDAGPTINASAAPVLLGDVAICPKVAEEQAVEAGSSLAEELCFLLIHGILHICGFDHETDNGQMDERQAVLAAEICR